MDFPRQRRPMSRWNSRASSRAAVYALLYSAVTIAIADPLAAILYQSIRESLHLPYSGTTLARLFTQQSLLVYVYFFIFAYITETSGDRN